MPKPTFNIEQYELRGLTPDVFTKEQQEALNKTLARTHGQIDWTAQLLGFNGTNYWGLSNPKADFSYNWTGLPETMNEKRQMQVGAFGVYNKDKDYDQWPSPFNRSLIKASGDANIHVFERDGSVHLAPSGQGEGISYDYDPSIFVGASYVFDAEVVFTLPGGAAADDYIETEYFYKEDKLWTRIFVKQVNELINVSKVISTGDTIATMSGLDIVATPGDSLIILSGQTTLPLTPARLQVIPWQDITDWTCEPVRTQFIGVWGNKGNTLSMDFSFDALDLHGFDEVYGLRVGDQGATITVEELLAKVGLEPTQWTGFLYENFDFSIGENCDILTPANPIEVTVIDNGDFDDTTPPTATLDNGVEDSGVPTSDTVNSGIYERTYEDSQALPPTYEFGSCEADCSYKVTIEQSYAEGSGAIGSFTFHLEALAGCGALQRPCIEWLYEADMDNGEYDRVDQGPTIGPFAIANEGEYDRVLECGDTTQGLVKCDSDYWCGYNNGFYDRPVGVDGNGDPLNCDADTDPTVICSEADGGVYLVSDNYEDCDCYTTTCCLVDNDIYDLSQTPPAYLGPNLVNGGINNGGNVGTDFTRCESDPLRVSLSEIVASIPYQMEPSIQNSLSPLRIWKNHVLTVVDNVPPDGTEYYNFLVADENRGPEPEDAYRYFVRLPLEYARDGKEWQRAIAVCNNMGYFSAPPSLAETEDDPKAHHPPLYDESYFETEYPEYQVFYEESYLSSTLRRDNKAGQGGFEDSKIAFDPDDTRIYTAAAITEYDPYNLRKPDMDGEWLGSYLVYDNYLTERTGFIETDLVNNAMAVKAIAPVYDESRIKNPNVEFPDSNDEAPMKNYVVSYAYFVTDFSAADDPVFEPGLAHNWRRPELECSENIDDECVATTYETNTAYRLHQYSATCS